MSLDGRKKIYSFVRENLSLCLSLPRIINKASGACHAVSKRIATRCRKGRKPKQRQLDYPDSHGSHTPVTGRRKSYRYQLAFVICDKIFVGQISTGMTVQGRHYPPPPAALLISMATDTCRSLSQIGFHVAAGRVGNVNEHNFARQNSLL
jgi:hypothetical protein